MLVPHKAPIYEGRFLARYDRFIATVELAGEIVEAHCVNPGRMEGLIVPNARAWVSKAPLGSKRKLAYTLELMEIDGECIGVNTQLPNHLAEMAIRSKLIPRMKRFGNLTREVRYGQNSRIDLLLTGAGQPHYVEVKNCHLTYPDGGAYFPDSVSTRAAGHLAELERCVRLGAKATVLFTVQRSDGKFVRPSDVHDPEFADAARRASAAGVRFQAVQFAPAPAGFVFVGSLPVDLKTYPQATVAAYRDANSPRSGWTRRGARQQHQQKS